MNDFKTTAGHHTDDSKDRLLISQVISDWVFFRDGGNWQQLRGLFAADGRMTTNSMSGSADEFLDYARGLRSKRLLSHHFPGPSSIQVNADKAVVQTLAMLMTGAPVNGVDVDIWVLLRYLDRFVREDGAWKIQDRHPMYIKDRLDPATPGTTIQIEQTLLNECPQCCRYLIYMARVNGAPASAVVPTEFGTPAAEQMISAAEIWLRT